jgi:hypothetical protein
MPGSMDSKTAANTVDLHNVFSSNELEASSALVNLSWRRLLSAEPQAEVG